MNSGEAPPPGRKAWNVIGHVFNLPRKYRVARFLGKAGHHPVCVAINGELKKFVAIIKMENAFLNFKDATDTYFMLKVLPLVNHKNIVQILELIPPQVDMMEEFYLVYEMMHCDLTYAIKSDYRLSPKHVLYQILCALHYVYPRPPLLNNLNLNNVMLNPIDNVFVEVKISDYYMLHSYPATMLTEYAEPTRYEAPEVLVKSSHLDTDPGGLVFWSPGSMWSLGCILMEILTHKPLFPGTNNLETLQYIVKQLGKPTEEDMWFVDDNYRKLLMSLPPFKPQSLYEKFPYLDPQAIDLVTKMIVFNPYKRISATDAFRHPYMDDMRRMLGPDLGSQLIVPKEALKCYNYLDASSYAHVRDMIFRELNLYK